MSSAAPRGACCSGGESQEKRAGTGTFTGGIELLDDAGLEAGRAVGGDHDAGCVVT